MTMLEMEQFKNFNNTYLLYMAIVYCTTNKINGKKYIGSHNGNKSSYLGSGVNLTKAIKKYGKKNFIRQTLWEGLDNFRYEIEEYWISYFDAANNQMFYNATEKGVGAGWVKGKKRNPQQYEKRDYLKIDYSKRYIDYSKIDYKISREKAVKNTDYKTRDIKRLTNTDFSNRNCNQMNTLNSINKRSQSNKKPIIQYDLKGNFIKEWESQKDIKNQINLNNLSKALKSNQPLKEFYWKYKK